MNTNQLNPNQWNNRPNQLPNDWYSHNNPNQIAPHNPNHPNHDVNHPDMDQRYPNNPYIQGAMQPGNPCNSNPCQNGGVINFKIYQINTVQ